MNRAGAACTALWATVVQPPRRVTCINQRTLQLGGGRPLCGAFRAYPESKWLRFHAVTAPLDVTI